MSKNAQPNWDDIRYVVAVADHGSVAGAARALSVNHATVLRRIASFESREGVRVFDRTPRGYQVSPDRRALIEAMREAGQALGQVEEMIDAERPNLLGGIRVTSVDTFCHEFLPSLMAGLAEEIGSRIDVISDNTHLDFARFQAHVTVRPAVELPRELTGEKAAFMRFGIYAPAGDVPEAWLGLSGAISRSAAGSWMRQHHQNVALTADSFVTLAGLCAAGCGKAMLPVVIGDIWPGLQRQSLPDDVPKTPIWVASHVDFARSGRLLKARKYLVAKLRERQAELMG